MGWIVFGNLFFVVMCSVIVGVSVTRNDAGIAAINAFSVAINLLCVVPRLDFSN